MTMFPILELLLHRRRLSTCDRSLPDRPSSRVITHLKYTHRHLALSNICLHQVAVGSVKLASSDPFTFPLMDPNYLATEFDRFTMLQAVKAARQFVSASPWQGFVNARFGVMGAAETDDEIVAAARDSVVTIWHPTSSARMSPKGSERGVVDPDLLVKHIADLRIVDASVFVSFWLLFYFCAVL